LSKNEPDARGRPGTAAGGQAGRPIPHALLDLLAALGQVGLGFLHRLEIAAKGLGLVLPAGGQGEPMVTVAFAKLAIGVLALAAGLLFEVGCLAQQVLVPLPQPDRLGTHLVELLAQVGVIAQREQLAAGVRGV